MVKIYTKSGDSGTAALFGGGRVSKGDERLEAYGTLDELNAFLGWYLSLTTQEDLAGLAAGVQPILFDIGAHVATPMDAAKARGILPEIHPGSVTGLEQAIDRLEGELEPLHSFILPGGTEAASVLHAARAVCRRGERAVVIAGERHGTSIASSALAYLNRLSDLLFVMARVENRRAGVPEPQWKREHSLKEV